MQTRRDWLRTSIILGAGTLAGCTMPKKNSRQATTQWTRQLEAIEAGSGGRLGVAVQCADGTQALRYRADERFMLCSTFKLPLAARVLQMAEQGQVSLTTVIPYTQADLLSYAPVAEKHLADGGMTVKDLCAASVLLSDNTAANLLMRLQGGPEALTLWLRGLGDARTRVDRWEPAMNYEVPGQDADTTTPEAMAATVQDLMLPGADAWLSDDSRTLLREWMVNSPTGAKRLRAGLTGAWTVGGKTGSGENGTVNDVCTVWLDGRQPVFTVAAYLKDATALDFDGQQKVLADVGRVVGEWWRAQHA